MKPTAIRIPDDLLEQVYIQCAKTNDTVTGVILQALRFWFDPGARAEIMRQESLKDVRDDR